jgi:hypothetical protein
MRRPEARCDREARLRQASDGAAARPESGGMGEDRGLDALRFLALFFVALTLGPSLAHLLELPNKMDLSREDYLTVQQIYRGWALLGFVVAGALLSTAALTLRVRARPRELAWSLTALAFLVVGHAIFWVFTFPANQATANWTALPENWLALRSRWEYSHAAAAVLNLLALTALIAATLAARTAPHPPRAR